MRLVVLYSGAMIADVVCGREEILVGSDETCRVRLPDPRIAARQLLIAPGEGGPWRLRQLDSSCLLKLNGRTITAEADLGAGDEVQLLDFSIRVYPDYDEKTPGRAPTAYLRQSMERFVATRLPPSATVRRPEDPVTVQPAHLDLIGRAGVVAANCAAIEEMIDATLRFMHTTMGAQRAWVGLRRVNYGSMEYEEGRHVAGQAVDLPPLGHDLKPRVLDRGQFILIPFVSAAERFSVLCGPLNGPDGTLGMVYIDTGEGDRRYDQKDLELFVMLLGAFAYHLDTIFKTVARNRAAMIEGQVSVTHETQMRLTPRKLPQSDELQFGAFREPGRERSGDIYDVVRMANGQAAFFVAQTAAGGSLPTILMAQSQSAFRYACMHQDLPHIFLQALNVTLFDGQRDHALHCFCGAIEPATGQLRYSLAGHVGAFIISARGEERSLALPEPQPALSLAKATPYPLASETLEPGETLVLFTSGVTTAKNRRGETFGEERFVNILCDGFGQPASATLKEMLTDLRSYTEGGQQPDDITVLLAHRV